MIKFTTRDHRATVEFSLEVDGDGRVWVKAFDGKQEWSLGFFAPGGGFALVDSVPDNLGIAVDEEGHVITRHA